MKTAILIPHFHKDDKSLWLLYNLLDSIQRHNPDLMQSVVVVEDGGAVTNEEFKLQLSPYGITGLRSPVNRGFAKTVNLGLKFLKRNGVEYCFLLNNDLTLIQPLSPVLEYFRHMKDLAIAGIRLWYPDGRLQHGGFMVDDTKGIHHPGYGLWEDGLPTRIVDGVTGAAQALNLGNVGLYPEEYQLSYEDVALCLRLWQRGLGVLYTNAVSAIHNESSTRGYVLGEREFQSINEFHREDFQFPEVANHRAQWQARYPHELLQTLLSHQPIPPYVRDWKRKDLTGSPPTGRAPWALIRMHRKLKRVGPGTILESVPHHATLDMTEQE